VSGALATAAVFDTVVVGAGVIGLAIARAEALRGREVVILEREPRFGTATSSRNSEVIHAGIYNPTDTGKTRLCVAGRPLLYRYCAERGVDQRCTGKLLVATDEDERATLERLLALSRENGITGEDALVPLSAAQVRELEPEVFCIAGALSPSTGVVDPDQLMRALLGDAEQYGAHIAYHAPVEGATASRDGFTVRVGGERGEEVRCRRLINSAGLGANDLARKVEGYDPARVPRLYLVKGSYFTYSGPSPFRRPIYPTRHGGLSVHSTIDLGGRLKFGPDAEYVPAIDYAVDPARAEVFYRSARRFWPGLPDGSLQPGYAGIRPKLIAPGEQWRDFAVDGPAQHGIAGLVQLYGIESPGLTACLALADLVAGM
jgi:L-2-hydroxyglutarate oxidase LhgO